MKPFSVKDYKDALIVVFTLSVERKEGLMRFGESVY